MGTMRHKAGKLLKTLTAMPEGLRVLMDRAYEDNQTRQLVLDLG